MAIEKCECCKGQKKIMGLGCMLKDCEECKGIGSVETIVDEIEFLEKVEKPKAKPVSKRTKV